MTHDVVNYVNGRWIVNDIARLKERMQEERDWSWVNLTRFSLESVVKPSNTWEIPNDVVNAMAHTCLKGGGNFLRF